MTSQASREGPPVASAPLTRPHFNESYIHLTDMEWLAIQSDCRLGARLVESLTFIGWSAGIVQDRPPYDAAAESLRTLMVGLDMLINRRFIREPCKWRNDGELPMVEIIDLLTGERTEACDHSFAGGFHAALWCVHRLMRAESEVARA